MHIHFPEFGLLVTRRDSRQLGSRDNFLNTSSFLRAEKSSELINSNFPVKDFFRTDRRRFSQLLHLGGICGNTYADSI